MRRLFIVITLLSFPLTACVHGHSSQTANRVEEAPYRLSTHDQVNARFFLDNSRGWAVGTTDQGGDLIIATSNCGKSWRLLDRDPDRFELRDVFFIDSLHGWVCGGPPTAGVVSRTVDGGRTWQAQGLPYGAMAKVHFDDALHGTLWGGNGEPPPHNRLVMLKTSDGGIEWTLAGAPSVK